MRLFKSKVNRNVQKCTQMYTPLQGIKQKYPTEKSILMNL